MQKSLLILLLLVLMVSSCTIEKMRYSKGYHIEWASNKKHSKTAKIKQKKTDEFFAIKNAVKTQNIDTNVFLKEKDSRQNLIHKTQTCGMISSEKIKIKANDKKVIILNENTQKNIEKKKKNDQLKAEIPSIVEGLLYLFLLGPIITTTGVLAFFYGQVQIATLLMIAGGVVSLIGLVKVLSFLFEKIFT